MFLFHIYTSVIVMILTIIGEAMVVFFVVLLRIVRKIFYRGWMASSLRYRWHQYRGAILCIRVKDAQFCATMVDVLQRDVATTDSTCTSTVTRFFRCHHLKYFT